MNCMLNTHWYICQLPLLSCIPSTHDELLQVEVMLLLQIRIKVPSWNDF